MKQTSLLIKRTSAALCIIGMLCFVNSAHADDSKSSFKELMAKASPERGRVLIHQCNDCHTIDEDGPNRYGPNIFGIMGAHIASNKDYKYSSALKAMHDKTWTPERMNEWLQGPKKFAPGTKMGYPGVASAEHRADIIAFMKTLKSK